MVDFLEEDEVVLELILGVAAATDGGLGGHKAVDYFVGLGTVALHHLHHAFTAEIFTTVVRLARS